MSLARTCVIDHFTVGRVSHRSGVEALMLVGICRSCNSKNLGCDAGFLDMIQVHGFSVGFKVKKDIESEPLSPGSGRLSFRNAPPRTV